MAVPVGAAPPLPGPPPAGTRRFDASRRVRLADAGPDGRARLDAVARWLQDAASDDITDAGAIHRFRWVIRRTWLEVAVLPGLDEEVHLTTWCSGIGAAWAERRTSVHGAAGGRIEACSVWVSLDPASLRPTPLDGPFVDLYGPSTGGRRVGSRLLLPSVAPEGASTSAWPCRRADLDVLGHVNNAIAWAALDEEVARRGTGEVAAAAVEHRAAVAGPVEVRSVADGDGIGVWMCPEGGSAAVAMAATLRRRA